MQSGTELTNRYKHLLVEVKGIRHPRHARRVEQILQKKNGIARVSATSAGMLEVEWDSNLTIHSEVISSIEKLGLKIIDIQNGKEDSNEEEHHHIPAYLDFLGENTELYFAIGSGVFWGLGVLFSFVHSVPDDWEFGAVWERFGNFHRQVINNVLRL